MNLQEYKTIIIVATAISALIVASPALQRLLTFPQTEFFTELWILGPSHKAENYPFNITRNTDYNVFLGVGNHLGNATYYQIQVKLRNQTQPAANSTARTPSSLPSLYKINAFVADNDTWELPLTFSFNYTYDEALREINFESLTFNGNNFGIKPYIVSLDTVRNGYFENLFFELWIYNDTTGAFDYHERFTGLWFNITP